MSLVYLITNIINNSRYIGYTSTSLPYRRYHHLHAAKAEKPKMVIARAIKKYGSDNFKFQIIRDGLSIDEAWKLEERLIAELKPEYNVSSGGKSPGHGVKWTEERRLRQSAMSKGKKHSAEARAKMKASQAKVDRSHLYKSVICLDDGVIYPSTKHAAQAYGLHKARIISVCGGSLLSANGRHFAYYRNDFSNEDRVARLKAIAYRKEHRLDGSNKVTRRSVICAADGKQYPSVRAAAAAYGLKAGQ